MRSVKTAITLVAAACVIGVAPVLTAADDQQPATPDAQHDHSQQPAAPAGGDDMLSRMQQQMMAQMHAADAKLDALLKDLNAAKGDARIAALTAVVTELVQQQKMMHEHMGMMHEQMMPMMMGRGGMMKKD